MNSRILRGRRALRLPSFFLVLPLALLMSSAAAQQSNDVELCLALDGSGSVSSGDFDLQLNGYASAIENPAIVPQNSTVTIYVVQFSSSAQTELGPVTIDSQATADSLAADIRAIGQISGSTDIASAIDACASELDYPAGTRSIIDISTDGQDGSDVETASDSAVSAGVDAINAIGVGSGVEVAQLNALVRPQPANALGDGPGFVLTVGDFEQFTPAIEEKIQAEITGGGGAVTVSVMSPAAIALLIMVMLGIGVFAGASRRF